MKSGLLGLAVGFFFILGFAWIIVFLFPGVRRPGYEPNPVGETLRIHGYWFLITGIVIILYVRFWVKKHRQEVLPLRGSASFLNITGLTGKNKPVRSSDDNQLGKVHKILKNKIIMKIRGKPRERFFLPNHLIGEFHKKRVNLNIGHREFEEWWQREGPDLVAEYPLMLKANSKINQEDLEKVSQNIRTAFRENFSNKHITAEIEGNTCPYCRSQIHISDQVTCPECGLSYILRKNQYTLTDKSKAVLYNRQWGLRMNLPYTVNEMIQPDEWIYYKLFLSDQYTVWRGGWKVHSIKGALALTSQRIIHFIRDGGYRNNWEIPINDIERTCLYRYSPGRSWRKLFVIIELDYRAGDETRHMHIGCLTKNYRGEVHFLHKYLHILNEHILEREPRSWTYRRYDPQNKKYLVSSCPSCNKEIGNMALLCPECQLETDFGDPQFQEIDAKEPPFKWTLCPHCNSKIRINGPFCPRCGRGIDKTFGEFLSTLTTIEMNEQETIEPLWVDKRICAYCGTDNLVYAVHCEECGRDLG